MLKRRELNPFFFLFKTVLNNMSKLIILLLMMIGLHAEAVQFSLRIDNDSFIANNGVMNIGQVDLHGCSGPSLNLSLLKEGGSNATCIENRSTNNIKVTILIPVKLTLTTDTPMLVEVSFPPTLNNFTSIHLYKTRNQQIGGGVDMVTVGSVMNNNDVINAELELGAQIVGNGAKSTYQNYMVFTIGPNN
jgi:hypothetical protein